MSSSRISVEQIKDELQLVRFSDRFRINDFGSGIEEYDLFIKKYAKEYDDKAISATHLLVSKKNADIISYMTLSSASIGVTPEERKNSDIEEIFFNSFPAIKVGKLAVDSNYRTKYKGIGSLMITLARGFAVDSVRFGIACRFIVVDADVENDPEVVEFYRKNGFLANERYSRKSQKTVSMRLDVFLQ